MMGETTAKNPDWFVLMREWVAKGWGDNGVTLPFIVGAVAYVNNNTIPTIENARNLLDRMKRESVDGYVTEIGWCRNLEAPVLAARPFGSPGLSSNAGIRHPSEDRLCLVFSEELQRRWHSSDGVELVESLLREAEEPITNRRYSRDSNSKSYKEFTPGELQFIKDTLTDSNH